MTTTEINKLREETCALLQEKFGNIVFEEIPHRYTIDGLEYTPVSTIISQYENEFDLELRSRVYAEKNGMAQDEVKRMWKYNNLCATTMGTRTHEYGESMTNLLCGKPDLICQQNKPQYIEEENWLIPTYPQEFAIKQFYDDLNKSLHPICAEAKLSTKYIPNAKRICGTADILFYYDAPNPDNSGFCVFDWKTNASLTKDYVRNVGQMMKPPFENYYDEALSHYYLQFNLYQRMMESVGLKIIARRLVWVKRDSCYEVIAVPKIDDRIIDQVIIE